MALKVFEAFAGIGTQRMALKNIGVKHEVVAISEIDKHAIKSYEAIHGTTHNLGDISKLEAEDIPEHDLFTYSFPCFKSGTLILTDKGYKRIEDIEKGDNVLTHTNTYKRVVKPMVNTANHIYRLRTMPSEDLYVTKEHPFYVRRKKRIWNNNRRSYDRVFEDPQWIEAKDLNKDYYVGIAVNTKSKLPKWSGVEYRRGNWKKPKLMNSLNQYFDNNDFWWIVGRYMGDGWTTNYPTSVSENSVDQRVILCCAKDELFDITETLDRLGEEFAYNVVCEGAIYKIHIVWKELTNYLYQFGKGAENKRLTGDIINLPRELLKSFLEGYFSADGSIGENNLHKVTSISRELIYGVGQCVAKTYHRPYSIYYTKRPNKYVIEGRTVNQSDTYSLTFKHQPNVQDEAFYEDGYVWAPIRRNEKIEYEGFVYNFEVEDDNSYTANNIITHNCQDLSVAGDMKGLQKGTRSSLLYESKKVIQHIKPKYLLLENVKNLVSKRFKPDFDKWLGWLESQGYTNYWDILNATDYGIPQNRQRVFCVSIRNDIDFTYEFPEPMSLQLSLKDFLQEEVEKRFYLSEEYQKRFLESVKDDKFPMGRVYTVLGSTVGTGKGTNSRHWVYDINGNIGTLSATDYKQPKQILIKGCAMRGRYNSEGKVEQQIEIRKDNAANALTTVNKDSMIANLGDEPYIRKMTPLEYWRLMGIKDEDTYKAMQAGISNTQLYKQAGNSIVVPVLEAIFKNLFLHNQRPNNNILDKNKEKELV